MLVSYLLDKSIVSNPRLMTTYSVNHNQSGGPTLTNVTRIGRQVVKFGIIALVAMILGRALVSAAITYYRAMNPPPPPPPTVGFGILPSPVFPDQDDIEKPIQYILETPTDRLPEFGDRAKVFLMPKSHPSLIADERAKSIAASFDFVFEPEILDTRTYRWTRSQPLLTTFELDIVDLHFSLQADFFARPELLLGSELPTGTQAVNQIKSQLDRANLLAPDLATAAGEILYLKSVGGELQEAVSPSDADFIHVDLNRVPIDGQYRMFTPGGYQGIISGLVTGALARNRNIIQLESFYSPVEYSQVHTYPLRTAQSAWQVLQAGEGYLAEHNGGETAVIRSVQLGFYDSFEKQDYLQPIYVFEGDQDFLGYVPAISPEYLQ